MVTNNLGLILTSDLEAKITTFKQWRNAINGVNDSNAIKIDSAIQKLQQVVDELRGQSEQAVIRAETSEDENYKHISLYQGEELKCSFDIPKSVNSDPVWDIIT